LYSAYFKINPYTFIH